jgi:hypothetical protein
MPFLALAAELASARFQADLVEATLERAAVTVRMLDENLVERYRFA